MNISVLISMFIYHEYKKNLIILSKIQWRQRMVQSKIKKNQICDCGGHSKDVFNHTNDQNIVGQ